MSLDFSGRKQQFIIVVPIFFVLLIGCTVQEITPPRKIVLLAPFEGQYREVGYNALYASLLALNQQSELENNSAIALYAVDDGGTHKSAIERATALSQDPSVKFVIALGKFATQAGVQLALDDIPMLIVGEWQVASERPNIFLLTNSEIQTLLTTNPENNLLDFQDFEFPIVGSEVFDLEQFRVLRDDFDNIEILSSSTYPSEEFHHAYINSGLFVPEPNLLATLVYDATHLAIEALQTETPIQEIQFVGLNGEIQFDDGYWVNAPLNRYSIQPQQFSAPHSQ